MVVCVSVYLVCNGYKRCYLKKKKKKAFSCVSNVHKIVWLRMGGDIKKLCTKRRGLFSPGSRSPRRPGLLFYPAGVNLRLGGLGSWAKWMLIPGHLPPCFSPAARLDLEHVTSQAETFLTWKTVFLSFSSHIWLFVFLSLFFSGWSMSLPVIVTFLLQLCSVR